MTGLAQASAAPLPTSPFPEITSEFVRARLLAHQETVLVDVREEDLYASGHPLWASNFPLSRLELDAWNRIPRRDTLIALYGAVDDTDLAPSAASILARLGYTQVHLLAGGLDGWRESGGELFIDVNAPSKAFGELVAATRHTPMLSPEEVKALIDRGTDAVILDVRRFDEYQTMNIPGSTSVPSAELVLRVGALAPDSHTRVVVNCAGRTRSIIAAQSLVNAGIPNPVAALRNGTIGWTLAGLKLEHGANRRFPEHIESNAQATARRRARAVADHAGVHQASTALLPDLADPARTVYRFDVRTPEEYAFGHLPGFLSAPGGQLVQETDHHAPVRGARLLLVDSDGVRANMTGSWLAQMGWEVYALTATADEQTETGAFAVPEPETPMADTITPRELSEALSSEADDTVVLDFTTSVHHAQHHIPGAWFIIRSDLAQALARVPRARRYVLTCFAGSIAHWAAADLRRLTDARVLVLEGGTRAWIAAGFPLEKGLTRLASPAIDRYRRPYEGTSNSTQAMQAYLEWEYGLVGQLERDGTHGFHVLS